MKYTKLTPGVQSTLRRLGSNIQTARRKRRLSQADLALSMGVSVGTLKRLEAGEPGVSIATLAMAFLAMGSLERLEDALDITADDIGLLFDQRELPRRVRGRKREPTAVRDMGALYVPDPEGVLF